MTTEVRGYLNDYLNEIKELKKENKELMETIKKLNGTDPLAEVHYKLDTIQKLIEGRYMK